MKPYDYGNGLTIEDICDVVVEVENDKSKFSGEWQNDKRHGKGRCEW